MYYFSKDTNSYTQIMSHLLLKTNFHTTHYSHVPNCVCGAWGNLVHNIQGNYLKRVGLTMKRGGESSLSLLLITYLGEKDVLIY